MLPSAKRTGRAENALGEFALRIPEDISLELNVRVSAPESSFLMKIRDGRVDVLPDDGRTPDVSLHAEAETWEEMLAGSFNGLEAVHWGRLKVRGNLHAAMELGAIVEPASPHRWDYAVDRIQVGKLKVARLVASVWRPGAQLEIVEPKVALDRKKNPVLVLHGLSATKSSMLPTIVGLAGDREVHALDHPGHGDSDKPFVNYTPRFLAGTVIRYLDAIGADKVDMVGNSLGGRVSLEVASRWPDRVGRLVLYAPAMAPLRDRNLTQILRVVPSSLGMVPGIFSRSRAEVVLRTFLGGLDGAQRDLVEAAIDDFLRIYSAPSARRALYSALRGYLLAEPFGERGFWTNLDKVEAPSLFIWGRHDPLISWRYSRATAQWIPHAMSVIYEDGGHVPQIEHPERTIQITKDFLDGRNPRSTPTVTLWRG